MIIHFGIQYYCSLIPFLFFGPPSSYSVMFSILDVLYFNNGIQPHSQFTVSNILQVRIQKQHPRTHSTPGIRTVWESSENKGIS